MTTEWSDNRLNEAFNRLERAVEARVSKETYEHLKVDVEELKGDVKNIVNRSVTRQLIVVSSPLFLASVGLLIGIFTGRVG